MRRSKAPSMLNKAKRMRATDSVEAESHGSDPEDENYKWGSGSSGRYSGINNSNRNEKKRIFNVVWRDVSNKKHKTWKGDGTLEVNVQTTKAILKDETGNFLGCLSKPINVKLGPDTQMIVSGKEIEIQNEITDEEELLQLRERQMQNRNWGEEEFTSPEDLKEEEKKPKGGFKFTPLLVLKPPEAPNSTADFSEKENQTNWEKPSSSTKIRKNSPAACNGLPKELLCFIRPSELQQFLFQNVLDYYGSVKSSLTWKSIEALDIPQILQHICNHPSFIHHQTSSNDLMRQLISILPHWSEMGPFDSGKLEFVQFFLKDIVKDNNQSCIIFAKNVNTSNMLQGLCDFMHLKCLRLNANLSKDNQEMIFTEFSANHNNLTQVLLINSLELLRSIKKSTKPKELIVFDDFSLNMEILYTLDNFQNCVVYHLVTAYSIEELLLLNNNKLIDKENLLQNLHELSSLMNLAENCYLHTKIDCKCLDLTPKKQNIDSVANKSHKLIKNWKHISNPFDAEFLKSVYLDNCAENIVTIFYKNI